jgi:hypothetical protein
VRSTNVKNLDPVPAANKPAPPLREFYGIETKGQPPHPVTGGVDRERANVKSVKHPSAGGKH